MSGGFLDFIGPEKGCDVGLDVNDEFDPDGDLGVDFSVGIIVDVKSNITPMNSLNMFFIFAVVYGSCSSTSLP